MHSAKSLPFFFAFCALLQSASLAEICMFSIKLSLLLLLFKEFACRLFMPTALTLIDIQLQLSSICLLRSFIVWFDGEQIRSKHPDRTDTPDIYFSGNPLWAGPMEHQAASNNHSMMQQNNPTHRPPVSDQQQQQQQRIQQSDPNPPEQRMFSMNSAPETASTLSSMCTTLLQQLLFTAINYFTLISKTCISVIILFFSSSGQFVCCMYYRIQTCSPILSIILMVPNISCRWSSMHLCSRN